MSAVAGRKVLVYYTPTGSTEEVAIGALKSKSLSINKEPIDITTDDDAGYRAYIADTDSLRSCDIKLSGILKALTFVDRADTEEVLTMRFLIPGILEVEGLFKFTSAELAAELEDATTFDFSFSSSGAFTLAAPTP